MNKNHHGENDKIENSFVITLRQLHLIIAFGLIGIFCIFITGYFWGKKNTYQELLHCYKEEAFADKINTSLCLFFDPLSLDEDKDEIDKVEKIEEGSEE
jgi:hypothetical protein